ncbi:MAG: hypothetical protein K2Q97_02895 [Burkholderiaceae bacterium]|nr:hypothetical protein [Burkholderiaceae bacterium]
MSWHTQSLNSFRFGAGVLLLSVPIMLALWHQSAVRRLIFLAQFQRDTMLYRWGNRRALSIVLRACSALLLAAIALLQTAYFGSLEWWMVAVSPVVFYVIHSWIRVKSTGQFSQPVYATRWTFWFSQAAFLAFMTGAFMGTVYFFVPASQMPYLDRVYELQMQWDGAQSSLVKWILDAGAFAQAAQESIATVAPSAYWQVLAGFVFAPLTVFGSLALAYCGFLLSRDALRQTLGGGTLSSDKPAAIGPANSAVWAAVAVVLIAAYFQLLGYAGHAIKNDASPMAIRPMQPCEKIDGIAYQINTLNTIQSLIAGAMPQLAAVDSGACQQLARLDTDIAKGVDDYLDWYFSLGADYARLAMMLSGDVDLFLQSKINELVVGKLQTDDTFKTLQAAHEHQWLALHQTGGAIQKILSENRLSLVDRSCKVVRESSLQQASLRIDDAKIRLSTSAAAGMIGGVFASKLVAKVMTKSSMKMSAKVLLKAVAKKTAGKAAGALAGAGVGVGIGSAVPLFGTAVGAAVGAVVGVAIGIGMDITALAIEEGLTRAAMRKDLIESVTETLQPMRDTFGCR